MVTRNTDFRKVTFERDEEAYEALAAERESWLDQVLRLARLFVRVDRKAAYIGRNASEPGCGSIGQMASMLGYDGDQAMNLAWLGYALDGCEGLEEALRENHIPLPKAYQLGRIFEKPELVLEDDDWLHWAPAI